MRRALATVLLALLAAAPVLAAVTPAKADGGTRAHWGAARVQLVGVNRHGHAHGGDHFSARHLRDVIVVVHWQMLVGSHAQRLELIAPDGSVYQTFRTAVENATGQATVETHVPVAGSWITDYSLYGTWQVRVYLDETATPETWESFVLTH